MSKIIIVLTLLIAYFGTSEIVMRHDVDDALYLELGQQAGSAVGTFSGGCGTLIRPTWVVTAAHVADASWFRDYMDIGGVRYSIKRTIIHPDFSMSAGVRHDIALVELTEPVSGVEPARLYTDTDEVGKDIVFVGTGWSGTGDTGMVEGHIGKDRLMRGAQNRVEGVTGNYLRFTFDGPDSENALPLEGISGPGDSGGPALWISEGETFLVGVSSHQGGGEGVQGVYGVQEYYTRISEYHDWILENVQ